MRKHVIGIVCAAGLLAGCNEQSNATQSQEIDELTKRIEDLEKENADLLQTIEQERAAAEQSLNEQVVNADSLFTAKSIEAYPQTLYKSATLDMNGDGEEEIIELHVNAGKMENGLFAWDDGQRWLLVVKDGEKTYPIFDDFVQMGSVYFSTARYGREPAIVMLMGSHSDRYVQKFVYDKEADGYRKEVFYKKENTNDHYNRPASYAFFEEAYYLLEEALVDKTAAALEAGRNDLQDDQKRAAIMDPIADDTRRATSLFEIAGELNPELNVFMDDAFSLLNEMSYKPPTDDQMEKLKLLHVLFIERETQELVNKDENQIHPEIAEKLQRFESIVRDGAS